MKQVKQVNVYTSDWQFVRCYWLSTNLPDGYIWVYGKLKHKVLCA